MNARRRPKQSGQPAQSPPGSRPVGVDLRESPRSRHTRRSGLRYLLVWPIVTAYRRKVRQNLSWRLAGSHHSTVLLTLFLIGLLIFGLAVGFTLHEAPTLDSPDEEARVVAKTLQEAGLASRPALESLDAGALLRLMMTSSFIPNSDEFAGPGFMIDNEVFDNLRRDRWISVFGPDEVVIASSDPHSIGRSAWAVNPAAANVATVALDGRVGEDANIAEDRSLSVPTTFGSHPLRAADGTILGAVVVAKDSRVITAGSNLLIETVVGVIAGGLFFI
ncbi:MAG: hypothetical protein M3440_14880, partial [Chloroflexota bacterium]|nr:hypothetical protein [Chloroflexota bacterium]